MAKKKQEPKVAQPSDEQQKIYDDLVNDVPSVVRIPGTRKEYRLRWLRNGAIDKLAGLLIRPGSEGVGVTAPDVAMDAKLPAKAAAIYILNGYWKLKFFYWILWRWLYYVRQYSHAQLFPILEEGKKKVPVAQFFGITTLLTGARATLMRMTMKEAERTLRELNLEALTRQERNGASSSKQDISSSDS